MAPSGTARRRNRRGARRGAARRDRRARPRSCWPSRASSDAVSIRAVADAVGRHLAVDLPALRRQGRSCSRPSSSTCSPSSTPRWCAAGDVGRRARCDRLRAFGAGLRPVRGRAPGALPGGDDGTLPDDPAGAQSAVDQVLADSAVRALHGRPSRDCMDAGIFAAGRPAAGHAAAVVGRARHRVADDRQAVPAVGRRSTRSPNAVLCSAALGRATRRPDRRRPRRRRGHDVAGRAARSAGA